MSSRKRQPKSKKNILFYIGEEVLTLEQLGDAADLPFVEGLQKILDDGILGEDYVGSIWHDVFHASRLSFDKPPSDDNVLLVSLFNKWKDTEEEFYESSDPESVSEILQRIKQSRLDYMTALKLSTP